MYFSFLNELDLSCENKQFLPTPQPVNFIRILQGPIFIPTLVFTALEGYFCCQYPAAKQQPIKT
jgi:hypothetical protein